MVMCRSLRSVSIIGVIFAAVLIIGLERTEAVPLSRYGRANLARYGKRSNGGEPGTPVLIEDANSKGICKYTGVGELYWCRFADSATSGDADAGQ